MSDTEQDTGADSGVTSTVEDRTKPSVSADRTQAGARSPEGPINPADALPPADPSLVAPRREGFGAAVENYVSRVRGGELGSLPAVGGLIVLVIVFASLSSTFYTLNNMANLLSQGAGTTVIAIGLVFVLLLGEIDLSAGTASGVTAAVFALYLHQNGNLLGGLRSTIVFDLFIAVLLVAAGAAAWMRVWIAVIPPVIAVLIVVLGLSANPWLEILLAICVGTAIGCLTGFMVARVGIPSFVVTLALFLAWQGVVLEFVGEGGALRVGGDPVLFAVANRNLSVPLSWGLYALSAGGYAVVTMIVQRNRVAKGLDAVPTTLALIKAGSVVVLGGLATYALTLERSPNPALASLRGIPWVVPIILALLVLGSFVLNRTSYGRHVYAVGGNQEAARRAGINVPAIRMSVFVIASSVAAVGAIIYSSKVGGVDSQAGGGNTLLFAVGAAVIGGTSLFGGRGRVVDALIGGAVIATIDNGLRGLNQPAAVVSIVTGLVLLLAASVDAISRRRARASG
jgi:D-xylose transport system permease protein